MKLYYLIILTFLLASCSTKEKKILEENPQRKEVVEYKSAHQADYEKYSKKEAVLNVIIKSEKAITKKEDGFFNKPKFTPNGKKIIFTNENSSQLWVYKLESNSLEKVVEQPQCGHQFQISKDSEYILFRNKGRKGKKGRGNYSIMKYSLNSGAINSIYQSKRRLSNFQIINNTLAFLEADLPIRLDIRTGKVVKNYKDPFYYCKENSLFKDSKRIDKPEKVKNVKYIKCTYSSDGQNMFILTGGLGIIALDKSAQILNIFKNAMSINKLSQSKLLVYNQQEDNGTRITNSKLTIGFINSDSKIDLPNPKKELRFNPDWSSVENKIVYNNDNGIIKIISFNIENK